MKKKNWGRIGQGVAIILIGGGVAVAWMSTSQSQAGRPVVSRAAGSAPAADRVSAPEFALPDLNGKIVNLSDSDGEVRIVDFWATWCPPCRKEIPHFQKLHERYGGKGLKIIGVALDEQGADVVRPFTRRMNMTYTALIGNAEIASRYGGIEAIPTTFVLDRKGRVYKRYVGYRDYATFERDIRTLMAE